MRSKRSICCKSVSKGYVNHGHDSSSETRGRLAFFFCFRRLFPFFCRLVDVFVSVLGPVDSLVRLDFFSCDVVYNVSDIFGL